MMKLPSWTWKVNLVLGLLLMGRVAYLYFKDGTVGAGSVFFALMVLAIGVMGRGVRTSQHDGATNL